MSPRVIAQQTVVAGMAAAARQPRRRRRTLDRPRRSQVAGDVAPPARGLASRP
jgi:hypothetical protein